MLEPFWLLTSVIKDDRLLTETGNIMFEQCRQKLFEQLFEQQLIESKPRPGPRVPIIGTLNPRVVGWSPTLGDRNVYVSLLSLLGPGR